MPVSELVLYFTISVTKGLPVSDVDAFPMSAEEREVPFLLSGMPLSVQGSLMVVVDDGSGATRSRAS